MTRKLDKAQTCARSSTMILKGATKFFPPCQFCIKSNSHSVVLQNMQHKTLQLCCWLQPPVPKLPPEMLGIVYTMFKNSLLWIPACSGFEFMRTPKIECCLPAPDPGTTHDQALSTCCHQPLGKKAAEAKWKHWLNVQNGRSSSRT